MNKSKRSFLAAVAACMLPACGGGGDSYGDTAAQHLVSFYGDSITTGTHSAQYDVWVPERWSPTPVEVIAELSKVDTIDYSIDGASALAASIRNDCSDIAIIRFGVADTVYGTSAAAFATHICRLVCEAKVFNQQVLLTGLTHTMDGRTLTLNEVIRRCSSDLQVPFVDVYALPFYGRSDMADYIHPGACYSRRVSKAIAEHINNLTQASR